MPTRSSRLQAYHRYAGKALPGQAGNACHLLGLHDQVKLSHAFQEVLKLTLDSMVKSQGEFFGRYTRRRAERGRENHASR